MSNAAVTKHAPMPVEVKMALGRLFSMMHRPSQAGDVDTLYAIRAIVLDAAESSGRNIAPDYQPNHTRDRLRGAQGDM